MDDEFGYKWLNKKATSTKSMSIHSWTNAIINELLMQIILIRGAI